MCRATFDLTNILNSCPRRRIFRHKQRAAIFMRTDGNFVRADRARFIDDVLLVPSEKRTEYRDRRGVFNDCHVFDCLRRNLAEDFTGDDGLRA